MDTTEPPRLRHRLLWLLACVAAGTAVGALGYWLSGDSGWALALPVALAAGWLFVADPTQCRPRR